MKSIKTTLKKKVLAEIEKMLPEYYSLLLKLLQTYRQSITLSLVAASFRRGWRAARRGKITPIDQLWEGIDGQ